MDIVEWLQDNATETGGYFSHERRIFIKAADEIERLRAEAGLVAEAIEALREIVRHGRVIPETQMDPVNPIYEVHGYHINRAQRILSQLPEKSDGPEN